jgi:hypothetical protein
MPQRDLDKEDYWRGIIAKFLASDLPSKAAFCRAEGIKDKHLTNWQRIIRQRDKERKLLQQRQLREPRADLVDPGRTKQQPTISRTKPEETKPAFVPLSVANGKPAACEKADMTVAEIRVGKVVVSIFASAEFATIQALLAALQE